MKTAICVACGRDYETTGESLGEVLAEAQGATDKQLQNLRDRKECFEAMHGGPRGVCSLACLLRRFLSKPPS